MTNRGIWSKLFWLDTGERVLSTAAQAAVGILVAGGLVGLATSAGLITIGTAAALALLKAVVVASATNPETTLSPASPISDPDAGLE